MQLGICRRASGPLGPGWPSDGSQPGPLPVPLPSPTPGSELVCCPCCCRRRRPIPLRTSPGGAGRAELPDFTPAPGFPEGRAAPSDDSGAHLVTVIFPLPPPPPPSRPRPPSPPRFPSTTLRPSSQTPTPRSSFREIAEVARSPASR